MKIDLIFIAKTVAALAISMALLPVFGQVKQASHTFDEFNRNLAAANLSFQIPDTFKEVKLPATDDLGFDYAMEIPGQDFEVLIMVNPLKQSWENYDKLKLSSKRTAENPDSAYLTIVKTKAYAIAETDNYFTKNLQGNILWHFNANTGKSYMLNLNNATATRGCKYGLLVAFQKNRVGTVYLLFLSNDTGPTFFNKVRRFAAGIRFKS